MMEYKDVYDKFRCSTGKFVLRGTACDPDCYFLAARIWVMNKHGDLLIQQRQDTKTRWPSRWDCAVAGGVQRGENTLDAALRECHEELGLSLQAYELEPLFTAVDDYRFDDLFLLRANPDLEALVLQEDEVAAVRWATIDEVQSLLAAEQFVPYCFFDNLAEQLRFGLFFVPQPPISGSERCYIVMHHNTQQALLTILQREQGQLEVLLDLYQFDFLCKILTQVELMNPHISQCTLSLRNPNALFGAVCTGLGYRNLAPCIYRKSEGFHRIDQTIPL